MSELVEKVKSEFSTRFGEDHIIVKSPGRVNLVGGHTDYNEGFVLPLAIDKSIVLGMYANASSQFRCHSVDKDDYFETDLTNDLEKSEKGWPNYLLGVVDRLNKRGYGIKGFDCVFGGDIPIGAGLSSSAALEGGVLYGLTQLFNLDIPRSEMAKIAREAENKFVGVQCGIMDQFISLNGKVNKAMKLDCRSLDYEFYPFDNSEIVIVLCDTQLRHELASSEYNIRRSQCEKAVEILQQYNSDIQSLRDVSPDFLNKHRRDLDPTIFERSKYVVKENERVLQACMDLQQRNWANLGKCLFASHKGLKNEYEVSCRELDILVEAAKQLEGAFGARMMGGGFGGCTINLVEKAKMRSFCEAIQKIYAQETGKEIIIYKTQASEGTHLVKES